jgi:hypothetical protein
MKTIGKIFIGALVAVGGYALYMNWKKKQSGTTSAPITVPSSSAPSVAPATNPAATTTPTITPATSTGSTGFAPVATNPASSTTTVPVQSAPVAPPINTSAKSRFDGLIAGGGISNIKIVPGYGISYTQSGTAKSGRIPEIELNDQSYINYFGYLAKQAGLLAA